MRERFADPELSVQHIAQLLGCSADYLSHLFHVETKERLTHYIQRIRIEGAVLALETTPLNISEHHPDIEVIEFFDAPNLDVFLTLANSLTQTFHTQAPARESVLKGLLIALLGLFRNVVETGTSELNSDIGKVFQAKCLVRERFADPELSVQHIAQLLGCSADYLSHLFHVETKERLTHYIQRIRIEGAVLALETTP